MTKESKKFIIGIILAALIGFGSGYIKGYPTGYNHPDHTEFVNEVMENAGKIHEALAERLADCERGGE